MFRSPLARLDRPRPSRHELPRARRHLHQPRGPAPAPAPRGDPTLPGRARLDREARRALRRRALAPCATGLRRALGALLRRARLRRDRRARLAAARASEVEVPAAPAPAKRNGEGERPAPGHATGRSSRARPSNASPSSSSSGPLRRSSSPPRTPARLGLEHGGPVDVRSNGTSVRASRAREQAPRGGRRPSRGRARRGPRTRTWRSAHERALVDRPDQGAS